MPPESPYLTIDLDRVRENLHTLRAALPAATIRYAVKANPAEPILRLLAAEGVTFDVASVGEIDACDSAGIDGRLLTFGNTLRKHAQTAAGRGTRGPPLHFRHRARRDSDRRTRPRGERGMPHRAAVSFFCDAVRAQVRLRSRRRGAAAEPCPTAWTAPGGRELSRRIAATRPVRVGNGDTLCRGHL